MKRPSTLLLISVIIVSILIIFAVSWHSLEEIHYLKSFYPQQFTVEEAFYAALVELVKVCIISLPLLLIILVCLGVWWLSTRGVGKGQ